MKSYRNFSTTEAKAAAIFSSLLGSTVYLTTLMMMHDLTPSFLTAIRSLVAGFVLLIVAKGFRISFVNTLNKYSVLSAISFSLAMYFLYASIEESGTSIAAFLVTAESFFIPIADWIFFRKLVDKKTIALLLIGFVGIACLTLDKNLHIKISDLLIILSGILFGTYAVFNAKASEKSNPVALTCFTQFFAFVLLISFCFISDNIPASISFSSFCMLIYLGTIMTAFRFWMITKAMQSISATDIGILYFAEPAGAAVLGYFLLNERLTSFQWFGVAIIFIVSLASMRIKIASKIP